jgi:hypothetical protein
VLRWNCEQEKVFSFPLHTRPHTHACIKFDFKAEESFFFLDNFSNKEGILKNLFLKSSLVTFIFFVKETLNLLSLLSWKVKRHAFIKKLILKSSL